jgi:ABC-type antimicrobial peptide transport system permease subunit
MLRALGMRKERLIALITIQSTFFSIPGLISGIVVAFTLNTACRFLIF